MRNNHFVSLFKTFFSLASVLCVHEILASQQKSDFAFIAHATYHQEYIEPVEPIILPPSALIPHDFEAHACTTCNPMQPIIFHALLANFNVTHSILRNYHCLNFS